MPTPLGHALGALAAGWPAAGQFEGRRVWRQVVWIAVIGAAPDLDLLFGRHSMETHSLGAALVAGAIAAWRRWPVAGTRLRIFLAVTLAWLSHPILDAMGADTSDPVGVMLFWPFSSDYVATVSVFDSISRRYWLPGFVDRTIHAVVREFVILGPLALVVWWTSERRRPRRT